jgi:hypothetical protein
MNHQKIATFDYTPVSLPVSFISDEFAHPAFTALSMIVLSMSTATFSFVYTFI